MFTSFNNLTNFCSVFFLIFYNLRKAEKPEFVEVESWKLKIHKSEFTIQNCLSNRSIHRFCGLKWNCYNRPWKRSPDLFCRISCARPMFERQIPDFFSAKLQIRQNSVPLVTSVRSSKVKFGWTGLLSSYFPLAIPLLSPCYRLTSFHLIWLYLAYSLHILYI